MTTDLSKRSERLAELTDTIQRGLSTFIEVGRALLEVRKDRLWSDGWESFDAWCQDVHGFGKTYASRLITASQQAEELPSGQQPKTEREARKQRQQRDQEAEPSDNTSGAGTESPTPTADGDPAGVPEDRVAWVVERIGWLWDKYNATYGDKAERFAFIAGLENWQIRSET